MSTTLEQELEQAARSFDAQAHRYQGLLAPSEYTAERDRCQAFAARLRERAAWVRELAPRGSVLHLDWQVKFERLTGPIPSETAPTERKEP